MSVLNTAWYTGTVVPLIVAASIAIAVFLCESRPALLLARVGFYIPFVLSPVGVATSWRWLLNEDLRSYLGLNNSAAHRRWAKGGWERRRKLHCRVSRSQLSGFERPAPRSKGGSKQLADAARRSIGLISDPRGHGLLLLRFSSKIR